MIELLVVICVIAILAAMLLPSGSHKQSPTRIQCINNQRQICLGLIMWQSDNDNQFPWQRSTATNGTLEFISEGHAASQFGALAAYIKSFPVYICPADKDKVAATDYNHFTDTNTSYFINVDASTNTMSTVLTGDRNLQVNGKPVKPSLFELTTNFNMSWTHELHLKGGALAFADGHVEYVQTNRLNWVIQQQPLATNRLCVP